jgi:hypothetical protein
MVLIATTRWDYQVTSLRIKTTSIFMSIENFSILTILLRTVGQWGYRDFRRLNIFANRRKRWKKGKGNQTSSLQVQTLAEFALNPGPKHEASCLTNTQKWYVWNAREVATIRTQPAGVGFGCSMIPSSCPLSLGHCKKVGKWLLSVQVWEMLQNQESWARSKIGKYKQPTHQNVKNRESKARHRVP